MSNPLFKKIPSVHELLEKPPLKRLMDKVNHNVVASEVRSFLENLRNDLRTAAGEIQLPTPGEMAERIATWIAREQTPPLRTLINATGVLLHTGLGRAPMAAEAAAEMAAVASNYASVEVDLETGERGQRVRAVEKLLTQLTLAEAAVVVNNNAAATLLVLAAVPERREVIVSRGQLIEIGGSYRLPDVMKLSGCELREVGTTNKTRIGDYEAAINEQTGAILRVHTSNYRIVGFTESATLKDLCDLARRRGIPMIDDIGSGALVDYSKYGLTGEPVASDSIRAGADLVLFSGDKLVGGPQCGIVVGKEKWIRKLLEHPLMRALRVDKCTLAGLAATLRLYLEPDETYKKLPLLALLSTSIDNLQNRAERLAAQMKSAPGIAAAEPLADTSPLGGGAVPTQELPTWCIGLTPQSGSVDQLARALRNGVPAVVGRIKNDRVLLDLRTVRPSEDVALVQAVAACAQAPVE